MPADHATRRRLDTIIERLLFLLVFGAVFAVHTRWVLTHFSSDGYLRDSGWFAYLFESRDPLLHNPSAISHLSFYAYHLAPHLFLFGAPLSFLFGLNGFEIFAVHQGLFFGLFFVAVYLMATTVRAPMRDRVIATLAALLIGVLSNILFQAAAYPHYEIAMLAVSSLAIASWVSRHRWLFLLCVLYLPLIREDGGFYVAAVSLACMGLEYRSRTLFESERRTLPILMVSGILISACAFVIQKRFFPGFNTFAEIIAGNRFDHVSADVLGERLRSAVTNPNIAPVLAGSVLLATRDLRYAIGLVVLSPLYLLDLLALYETHGHFTLYLALPWLLPVVVWLAVFVTRARAFKSSVLESIAILALTLAGTAPVHAAAGSAQSYWYVPAWALTRPIVEIRAMQDFAVAAKNGDPGRHAMDPGVAPQCVSTGIAAIIPNHIQLHQLVHEDNDISRCRSLVLLRGDFQHAALIDRARAQGFRFVASRLNVQLWVRKAP